MKFNYAHGRFLFFIVLLLFFAVQPELFYRNIRVFTLTFFGLYTLDFIWHFGKKIQALDFLGFYAIAAYLLAPSLSYYLAETEWYEGYNFMPIPPDRYFSVAIPGTLALLAGINFPFKSVQVDHRSFDEKIQAYLKDKPMVGVKVFWIGFFSILLEPVAPSALKFFLVLGSYLVFIGGLYVWFSPMKGKLPYMLAVFIIPAVRAMQGGMFGEIIFWSIFTAMVMVLRVKLSFPFKLGMAVFAIVFVTFLQSVKYEVRRLTWYATEARAGELSFKADMYKKLIHDRVENPELLFGRLMLSGALDRTNQGSLTAMAIRYTPEYEPFARGETIFMTTLASVVPRFVWPSKPQVGGRQNMLRFTGYDIGEETSMDIGQLGDAYVNFDRWGGAVFLFTYGLFFCFIFAKLFEMGITSRPSMILWIPIFFCGVVHADTSVLACLNHVIKVSMFLVFLFWAYEKVFGEEL